jgi:hypothetical protein
MPPKICTASSVTMVDTEVAKFLAMETSAIADSPACMRAAQR